MPSITSPGGIIYPVPTDPIAPLNAVFQDLAESAQEAIVSRTETTTKVDDYALTIADLGVVVVMNKAGVATVTVPTDSSQPFPIGSLVWVYNISASDVNIVGDGGVTVRNAASIGQYAEIRLRKRSTNEWVAESTQATLDAFQTEINNIEDALGIIEETAANNDDHTLELADKGKVVLMDKSTAANLTVPTNSAVPFPLGTIVYVYNAAADAVTVAGDTGVVVRNAGTVAQYAQVMLRKRAANEWVMVA